jgi:ribosome maturation factor RimP
MMIDLGRIEKAVEPVLAQEAVELVDLRYLQAGGRWVLRFYIEKHGGVTLDDCERVSSRVGPLLDALGAMPHSYCLEVSSPGVDRVIKKKKDFERFSGHRVKVRLRTPVANQRRFQGFLKGVDGEALVLSCGAADVRLELKDVEEARLDPEVAA